MKKVKIKNFKVGAGEPLLIVSGPCIIESEEHTLRCAEFLYSLFSKTSFNFVFKASYDKANRSSIHSYRGPGLEKGLRILAKVKKEFGVPILTDVHTPEEALIAAEVCDVVQIPAFLCRQTDLLLAAAKTTAVINIKKGQFMAPWDMENVVKKIIENGHEQILLTERGVSFGYNNLVTDFRAIPIMQRLNFPVLYDATHAAQLPGALGESSGGEREFIPLMIRAAIASGCNGIYAESHPDPTHAKSDAATVLPFDILPSLVLEWERLSMALHTQCV